MVAGVPREMKKMGTRMSNFQRPPDPGGVHGDIFRSMGEESVRPDPSTAAEDGAGDSWFSRIGSPRVLAPARRNSATGTEFD